MVSWFVVCAAVWFFGGVVIITMPVRTFAKFVWKGDQQASRVWTLTEEFSVSVSFSERGRRLS